MDITVISSARAQHQLEHQEALLAGLGALGITGKKSFSETHVQKKYVACWGWRIGRVLRERGHEVLVMERGYIGDRFSYTSLGWNGLNGRAEFPDYPDDGGERFRSMGATIKPWKAGGDYALVLGQVPHDASLRNLDLMPWYVGITKKIKMMHGLPVHFRPHPDLKKKGMRQTVPGTVQSEGSLDEALQGAAFTVTFNSNSSVDSVLAGVPCIVGDRGSMAYEVCGKAISEVIRPDRTEWVHRLAFRQWSLEEIRSGLALIELFKNKAPV